MLRAEPVTVLCILISVRSFQSSHKSNANYNPTKCYLPILPDAFIYSKKWPVLIRPSLAGFDSTADSQGVVLEQWGRWPDPDVPRQRSNELPLVNGTGIYDVLFDAERFARPVNRCWLKRTEEPATLQDRI
jgi:hypothetical protein